MEAHTRPCNHVNRIFSDKGLKDIVAKLIDFRHSLSYFNTPGEMLNQSLVFLVQRETTLPVACPSEDGIKYKSK